MGLAARNSITALLVEHEVIQGGTYDIRGKNEVTLPSMHNGFQHLKTWFYIFHEANLEVSFHSSKKCEAGKNHILHDVNMYFPDANHCILPFSYKPQFHTV